MKLIKATELYKLITKEDVYKAFRHIVSNNIDLIPATKYEVKIYDQLFPPKDFLRIVAEQKGYIINEVNFSGGKANKPFENLGYEIIMKTSNLENILNKKLKTHKKEGNIFSWDWYSDLKKYSIVMQLILKQNKNYGFKDYNELNSFYLSLDGINSGDDFLERYLFMSSNGVSLIRNQLIKHIDRHVIREKVKQDISSLIHVFNSSSTDEAFNNLHQLIKVNKYTVIKRFVRTMFPEEVTSIDSIDHFKILIQKINNNYSVNLDKNKFYDTNKYLMNILNEDDIYLKQIFYWLLKEEKNKNMDKLEVVANDYKLKECESPLNQILYGPPGTGKTYQTISKAIAIIDPKFYEEHQNNREVLTAKFRELTILNWSDTKGQIAFCTFHQSFTYEDFVEGIKPKVINEKDIIYEIQKGVFKSLCDRARTATNDTSDFDTIINKLQNKIIDEGIITLTTNRGKKFDVNYRGQTTFRIKPHESSAENPQYPASIENIRMLYEGAPLTDLYNPSYVKGILEYLYSDYGLAPFEEVKNSNKPYIIVVDEINRGNVASIFGELITLIEEGKRQGKDEELSVILPYSKKEFKVPSNVYIIGTMNTADRSVEALDSALRRRFNFEEVMPNYNVIISELKENNDWYGFKISDVLQKINKRITRLIDRDHQIGHSYFLKLKQSSCIDVTNDLKQIFAENIMPLLQEYFFNDFNKIGLVLGSGFLSKEENNENLFASFEDGGSSDYEDDIYELLNPIDMDDETFVEAVKKLFN